MIMDNDRKFYGIYELYQNSTGLLNGPFGVLPDLDIATRVAIEMFGDRGVARETNPDHMQGWGVGSKSKDKSFDTVPIGKEETDAVELIFGEHPHSRQDHDIYARWPDGRIEGFNGHRLIHEITFREYNYLKTSGLSGNEVREGGECEIVINGVVVEKFFFRRVQDALLSALRKLDTIHGFPFKIWDVSDMAKMIGRRVYYRDQPAIVEEFMPEDASVILIPESGEFLPCDYEIEEGRDREDSDRVKDTIYSTHIFWWRK